MSFVGGSSMTQLMTQFMQQTDVAPVGIMGVQLRAFLNMVPRVLRVTAVGSLASNNVKHVSKPVLGNISTEK